MLTKITGAAVTGIDAITVTVEVAVSQPVLSCYISEPIADRFLNRGAFG